MLMPWMHLRVLLQLFPRLRFLSLPATLVDNSSLAQLPSLEEAVPPLEQIELTPRGSEVKNFQTTRLLTLLAKHLPMLWQIRLHEAFVEFDDIWADIQDVEQSLQRHAVCHNGDSGDIIIDPGEARVVLFDG